MANRRMLHRNVSVNEQLADCSLLARLLYTWGLPHTSDWGVLAGSPRRLKAQIFPVSEESPEEIAGAAQELVAAGLWVPFTDNGSDYVCYPTFDKYQDVHNRTAKPRDGLPVPPTSRVLPANTVKPGKTPPKGREGKGTQENSREEKRGQEAPAISPGSARGMKRPGAVMLLANYCVLSEAVREVYGKNWSQAQQNDFVVDAATALEEPGCQVTEREAEAALRGDGKPHPDERPEWWVGRLSKAKPKRRRGPSDPSEFHNGKVKL